MRSRADVGLTVPGVEAVLYFAVLALVSIWAICWVIGLAVRHGINDALRMNRDWLSSAPLRPSLSIR